MWSYSAAGSGSSEHERLKRATLLAHRLREPFEWHECAGLPVSQCLEVARAACLTEEDLALGPPCSGTCGSFISPRNEAAALSLLLANSEDLAGEDSSRKKELHQLCDGYLDRALAASPHGGLVSQPDTELAASADDGLDEATAQADALHSWCRANGVQSRAHPAVFAGGLRGMAASEDLEPGSVLMSVPVELLITAQSVSRTDLGTALAAIPGLDEDTLLLLWTMCDRHDDESQFCTFWAALPDAFHTGLSASFKQLRLLRHTPVSEEATTAWQHVRDSYDATKPLLDMLVAAYPQFLKPEFFTQEAYLWAVELWYAYAIKVQFPNGNITSALVPLASLINHSPYPHVVHFSKVDSATNTLRLRTFRSLKAGEQCFLSYGPHSSGHLLLFYGFSPFPNPFDTISLNLAMPSDSGAKWGAREQALKEHGLSLAKPLQVGLQPRLPVKLLATARVLAADGTLLKRLMVRKEDPRKELSATNEAAAAALLKRCLQKMLRLRQLGDAAPGNQAAPVHSQCCGDVPLTGAEGGGSDTPARREAAAAENSTSSGAAGQAAEDAPGGAGASSGQAGSGAMASQGPWEVGVGLYIRSHDELLQHALSLLPSS